MGFVVMFIGPMATLGSVPRLAAIRGDVEAVLAGLMLLLPLVVHDLYVEKRVHKVTLYGGIGFVVIILAPLFLRDTEFVRNFLRDLV